MAYLNPVWRILLDGFQLWTLKKCASFYRIVDIWDYLTKCSALRNMWFDLRQNEENCNFDTFYRISVLYADRNQRWNLVFCVLFLVTIYQKYPFSSLVSWQNTFLLVFLKAVIWMFRCCCSCILIDYKQQVLDGLTPSRHAQDIAFGQGKVTPFHILSISLSAFSGETALLCSIINRIYIYIHTYIYIYHNFKFWRHHSIILPKF
jgi:hypothetical protein